MYSQKISYWLQVNGYKLAEKKLIVNNVHSHLDKVNYGISHIWKAHGKKDKRFTQNCGWIEVPKYFISVEQKQSLASNYFQTDDMYYTKEVRKISKKNLQKVIDYIQNKI